MRKSLLYVRSNLRRSKGQTVAIALLIVITALMLNIWLMLSLDYKQNFDRYHNKLNAEHVIFIAQNGEGAKEHIVSTITLDGRTDEYSVDEALAMPASLPYEGGEANAMLTFVKKDVALNRAVGKAEIISESEGEGIYLPVIYKTGDIDIGKQVEISLSGKKEKFTVRGFINSVMAGSHNCGGQFQVLVTEGTYNELEQSGNVFNALLVSVRLKSGKGSENYFSYLNDSFLEKYPDAKTAGSYYDTVKQARYISQGICSAVISIMAFLTLLIAVIVLVANVTDYVRENVKNLGALKAIGYCSRHIILSLIMQFAFIALSASIVGIALSYAAFPLVNNLMISQTGIPYAVRFLPLPAFLTLIIPLAVIALTVYLAALKIRRLEPITALKTGGETVSVKHNLVSLEKSKMPVSLTLGVKSSLREIKQNVAAFITMFMLSFVVVFCSVMIKNMIVDNTAFLDMLVGEITDSAVNVPQSDSESFYNTVRSDSRVEKIYMYHGISVNHKGGSDIMATLCEDFNNLNNGGVICEGRFPREQNEVALGARYAKENKLKVGDSMTLCYGGKEAEFKICGLTQITNDLGKDCMLLYGGYSKAFGATPDITYYIDLKSGVDINEFNRYIESSFTVNMCANVEAITSGGIKTYVSLMTVIVIAVIIISLLIIAFVLYLLVRSLLKRKRRDYGILKALGYTTGQLILQTAVSFMPSVIIASVIGLIVGSVSMNPLMSVFLSGVGIVKCSFIIPAGIIIGMGAAIMAAAFGLACLMSLKIGKITPKELVAGE